MKALKSSCPAVATASARQEWARRPRRALRILRLAGSLLPISTLPVFAVPVVYTDSYTLTTANQSMWGAGGQPGWSYASNLIGAAWGIYGSSGQPATFGLNAITGSVDSTIIPGIPSICGFGFCTPSVPPVTADTRTGGSLDGTTSGRVGLYVTAQAGGGALDVRLPVTSTLTIGDANAGGVFRVSGANALGAGATITAIAPSFKAGLDGALNLDASVKGTGCLLGFGCTSTAPVTLANINPGRFSLLGLDTSKTDPVSLFGLGVPQIQFGQDYAYRVGEPPCQGPVTQDGKPPVCDTGIFKTPAIGAVRLDNLSDLSGGTVSQGTLSLTTNQPVLRLTADLTGIAQYALGFTKDVLSPTVDVPLIGSLGGTILNVQAGVQFGLTQEFNFKPTLMTTLLFDKPVTQYVTTIVGYECKLLLPFTSVCLLDDLSKPILQVSQINRGTSVDVNLAVGADLRFTDEPGQFLGRTYFMDSGSSFTSDSRLSIDPTLPIKAGCLRADSNIPGIDGQEVCAFQENFRTTDLASLSVYKNTFALGGFNTASFSVPGDTGSDPPVGVPEPSTFWLALLGLGALSSGRVGVRVRQRLQLISQ